MPGARLWPSKVPPSSCFNSLIIPFDDQSTKRHAVTPPPIFSLIGSPFLRRQSHAHKPAIVEAGSSTPAMVVVSSVLSGVRRQRFPPFPQPVSNKRARKDRHSAIVAATETLNSLLGRTRKANFGAAASQTGLPTLRHPLVRLRPGRGRDQKPRRAEMCGPPGRERRGMADKRNSGFTIEPHTAPSPGNRMYAPRVLENAVAIGVHFEQVHRFGDWGCRTRASTLSEVLGRADLRPAVQRRAARALQIKASGLSEAGSGFGWNRRHCGKIPFLPITVEKMGRPRASKPAPIAVFTIDLLPVSVRRSSSVSRLNTSSVVCGDATRKPRQSPLILDPTTQLLRAQDSRNRGRKGKIQRLAGK